MRNLLYRIKFALLILPLVYITVAQSQTNAFRINQLGYYPTANKIAMVVFPKATTFEVVNTANNQVVFSGNLSPLTYYRDAEDSVRNCDFSALTTVGSYKIRIPSFGESFPFEISETVLRKAAYASLKSFYYQRSSAQIASTYGGLWARPLGHPDTNCTFHASSGKTGKISSPGGWYDAGDFGKYVVNGGIAVANLLSFYENFNSFFADGTIRIPESGNGKNDLLDEVKYELDWLKTMQDTDGGVFFKLSTLTFPGYVMPAADTNTRYMIGKSTTSTLNFAAMMAMAGRIYKDYDANYAADCLVRAETAWVWAKANPTIYFKNPADVFTGEYGDTNAYDEFLWAAAELSISTQKNEYKTYLDVRSGQLNYTSDPGWERAQPLAALSLATQVNGLPAATITAIKNSIISISDTWLNQMNANACRIPTFTFSWGSNATIANKGVCLLYAYLLTKDLKYVKGAAECADYLLGKNATGYSFVTGYGSKTTMNPHHRQCVADGIVQPIPGFVSGGPNSAKQDKQIYPFTAPAKCFIDVKDSYSSNEVCVSWNSPMTALFAGVDAILGNNLPVAFDVPTTVNEPPVVTITSPAYDSKNSADVRLAINATATDANGIAKVELYIDSRFIGVLTASPYQWSVAGLTKGYHTVTLVAFDTKGLATEKTNSILSYQTFNIPGKVEAEDFSNMLGISTQTTTDTNGGLNVTSLDANDYLDYSINVLEAGNYRVEFRVASNVSAGKFDLRNSSSQVLSTFTVNTTGNMQSWATISNTIALTAGKQTLRIFTTVAGFNLNWINFVRVYPTALDELNVTGKNSLLISPNPVIRDFNLQYNSVENTATEFVMYNINGKVVDNINMESVQSGNGEFNWKTKNQLVDGIYCIIMKQKGSVIAASKFIKIK